MKNQLIALAFQLLVATQIERIGKFFSQPKSGYKAFYERNFAKMREYNDMNFVLNNEKNHVIFNQTTSRRPTFTERKPHFFLKNKNPIFFLEVSKIRVI